MLSRLVGGFAVVVLVFAACSGDETAPKPRSSTQLTTTTGAPIPSLPGEAAPTTSTLGATTTTPAFTGEALALGIGDEYFPELGNPGYDVEHYTLDLTFDPDTGRLDGTVTIVATATDTLPTFNLDFSERGEMTITSVLVDGTEVDYRSVSEDLVIALQEPIPSRQGFTTEVEYGGLPVVSGSWISVGSQNYPTASIDGAHAWFPSNDHPLDKATYTFRITVPDNVTAAATGTFVDRHTGLGRTTWVWEMLSPMAPSLASVVIGDFDIVEDSDASAKAGIPIRHVLPSGTVVADWPGLERQGEMVAFLAEAFGPFPFETYGIAIVDGLGYAFEHQTLSLFDRELTQSARFENLLVHELAHQWFGDSVSLGQLKDIWLSEGFASYAEWLWVEREAGRDALETNIARERDLFAQRSYIPPGRPLPTRLFNGAVYRVGAMTLHALRLTVGDDVFFDILRTYAATYADDATVTADFVAVAETVSGIELDDLFESWLYTSDTPEFP